MYAGSMRGVYGYQINPVVDPELEFPLKWKKLEKGIFRLHAKQKLNDLKHSRISPSKMALWSPRLSINVVLEFLLFEKQP